MSNEDMEQILKEASKMIDEELQTNGVSFGKEAFAFIKNKFGLEQDYSVWRTIKTDEFIDFAEKEVNEK